MELFLFLFAASVFFAGIIIGGGMAKVSKANGDSEYDKTPKRDADDDEPRTLETKSRFPVDMALRRAGYSIYSRPTNGEAWWTKGGIHFRESEAVMRVKHTEAYETAVAGVFVG